MVDHPPWPMHHIDNFSWNHNSLSPGDVNGDGFNDYAVMHEGPDTYTVVFHPGSEGNDKALWPITQIGRGGNPEYSAIADFDGDGNMDVVAGGGADGSQPPGVKVFWGPELRFIDGRRGLDRTAAFFPRLPIEGTFFSWKPRT